MHLNRYSYFLAQMWYPPGEYQCPPPGIHQVNTERNRLTIVNQWDGDSQMYFGDTAFADDYQKCQKERKEIITK